MAAKTKVDRRAALIGESYRSHGLPDIFKVEPKSAGMNGQWICMTCGTALRHNLEKDLHCAGRATKSHMVTILTPTPKSVHVLAWLSFDSQRLEVP